jgi:hypothetical protein
VFWGPASKTPGGNRLAAASKFNAAIPTCLKLFVQLIRLAASRAAWTAGKSNPTSMPMIAMTTSNSTKVNPLLTQFFFICILLTMGCFG